ncbi:MAG: hypothetical protein NTW08_08310 [Gammaproteobacteria bacterium]|nr:hypothetical protein [Gammaproteobacteria bacterium]
MLISLTLAEDFFFAQNAFLKILLQNGFYVLYRALTMVSYYVLLQ